MWWCVLPVVQAQEAAADEAGRAEPGADFAEVITVTADRFARDVQAVPMSVSVIGGTEIEEARIVHAEDVVRLTPNVDFVGASGRPRYLLIRGMGDLGTGDLVTNPSIGVLIDEVDVSGVAGALTMLDVERVEVLRGPQGALYGSNALGGVIKLESRAPTADPEGRAEVRLGTQRTGTFTAAGGGRLLRGSDVLTARVAAQLHTTDGFMENAALDRKDTAGREEWTGRLRVRLQPDARTTLDWMLGGVALHNGYDHWTIDNSRTTTTDRPGIDRQRTGLSSLRLRADRGALRVEGHVAASTTDLRQEADFDWFGVALPPPPGSEAPEDYTVDLYNRWRLRQDTLSAEVRLGSGPEADPRLRWLVGAHGLAVDQRRELALDLFGEPLPFTENDSRYARRELAGFGQVEAQPIERLTLTAGGRLSAASQAYRDAQGVDVQEARPVLGWRVAGAVRLAEPVTVFVGGSEGSKLGGFNLEPDAPIARFGPETARQLELGLRSRSRDGALTANLTGFYVHRAGQQLSEWVQRPGGDAADVLFYTDNADAAWTAGLESEVVLRPADGLTLRATLGLLDARIARWSFTSGEGTVDYSGNRHAHAAPWNATGVVRYAHAATGLWGRAAVTATGPRMLANNNLIEDRAFAFVDASVGWRGRHLGVGLWARNLTDTTAAAAGFGPFFTPNAHVAPGNFYRWADGRALGVSVEGAL